MRINVNHYRFISIVLIVFGFSRCIEVREDGPPVYYITPETYNYFLFPKGSWWVYQDSISGNLDTVVQVQNETDMIPDWSSNRTVMYQIYQSNASTLSHTYPTHNYQGWGISANYQRPLSYGSDMYYPNSAWGSPPENIAGHFLLLTAPNKNYNGIFLIDSVLVGRTWFRDIKHYTITDFIFYGERSTQYVGTYIYAKNIGLIQKTHKDSLNWQLVEYYINK